MKPHADDTVTCGCGCKGPTRYNWREIKHNLKCGFHSGIPVCCVFQFAFDHFRLDPCDTERGSSYWKANSDKSHFIPCSIHKILIENGWMTPKPTKDCRCRG